VLLSSKSDPVITKDPGDAAWTHAAWDKGMAK
jgi:NitT/TauT family transport system substrate-binding protein